MPAARLVPCPTCGHEVATNAPACPNCGTPDPAYEAREADERDGRRQQAEASAAAVNRPVSPKTAVLTVLVAVVGVLSLCTWAASLSGEPDAPPVPLTPEQQAAADSQAVVTARADSVAGAARDSLAEIERDRVARYGAVPDNEFSVRRGVRRTLELVAHNPDGIDVRACTGPALQEGVGWVVDCDYTGTNGFGATVREFARFRVSEDAAGTVTAIPTE
ncbi:MAG TPA: hypothetical protein VF576_04195 [Rubricoccaceae bacterium]|jgi:hypothetical protein